MIRYQAIDCTTNQPIESFATKAQVNAWVDAQIKERGLDWRVGYMVAFRDRLRVEVRTTKGEVVKCS